MPILILSQQLVRHFLCCFLVVLRHCLLNLSDQAVHAIRKALIRGGVFNPSPGNILDKQVTKHRLWVVPHVYHLQRRDIDPCREWRYERRLSERCTMGHKSDGSRREDASLGSEGRGWPFDDGYISEGAEGGLHVRSLGPDRHKFPGTIDAVEDGDLIEKWAINNCNC